MSDETPRSCKNCVHYEPDDCLPGPHVDITSSWLFVTQRRAEFPIWKCPRRAVTMLGAARDLMDAVADLGRSILDSLPDHIKEGLK